MTMEHDKSDIYTAWDRTVDCCDDIKTFCRDYLCGVVGVFTQEQAAFLVDIIDEFVRNATIRHRCYLGSDGNSLELRDLSAISEELYGSVEEALRETENNFVGMRREDVEKYVQASNGFWRQLKTFVLGGVERGDLAAEMRGLLDKAEGEEATALFTQKKPEYDTDATPSPDDIIREQALVGEVRRGNVANVNKVMLDEMGPSDDETGGSAECLRRALVGDLLCPEEEQVKKLCAISFLALRLSEHSDEVVRRIVRASADSTLPLASASQRIIKSAVSGSSPTEARSASRASPEEILPSRSASPRRTGATAVENTKGTDSSMAAARRIARNFFVMLYLPFFAWIASFFNSCRKRISC